MIIVGSYFFVLLLITTLQKAEAQAYLQTIKYRNLVIDLDNGKYLLIPVT